VYCDIKSALRLADSSRLVVNQLVNLPCYCYQGDLNLDLVGLRFCKSEPVVGPCGSQVPTFRTGSRPTVLRDLPVRICRNLEYIILPRNFLFWVHELLIHPLLSLAYFAEIWNSITNSTEKNPLFINSSSPLLGRLIQYFGPKFFVPRRNEKEKQNTSNDVPVVIPFL
jgi:hypothetical protein